MSNERATQLFDEFIGMTREFAVRNKITPDEYHSVLSFLISLGETKEWPLFLDAFFESTIDSINYGAGEFTSSAVTGPYYKAGAPLITERPALLPMRPGEPGQPMQFTGTVCDAAGSPVPGALVDIWHASNDGIYSFYNPRMPDTYLLRGKVEADSAGALEFRSIRPVPYEIPKDGPVGHLMNEVLGRHSYRPAHLHFQITAPGFRPLVTQLYFEDDPYLVTDCCSAVKDDLVIPVGKTEIDGESYHLVNFDFVLQVA
jgi:catechol 1,2-dioxygenase